MDQAAMTRLGQLMALDPAVGSPTDAARGQRDRLLAWLPQVTQYYQPPPTRRLRALGDWCPGMSLEETVRSMRADGFVVLAPGRHPVNDNSLLTLLVHPAGMLAVLQESWSGAWWRPWDITIYTVADIDDPELADAANLALDPRRTTRLRSHVGYPGHAIALRTQLAALRASGTMVLPWPVAPITLYLGGEPYPARNLPSEKRAAMALRDTHRLLFDLPAWVHRRFGPHLLSRISTRL